jgi:hypothetical protein
LGGYPCDMEGFLHWNQNSNQDCIDDIRHSNKHLWGKCIRVYLSILRPNKCIISSLIIIFVQTISGTGR